MAKLQGGRATPLKNEHPFVRLAMTKVPALRILPPHTQRNIQDFLNCRTISAGSTIHLGKGNRDDIFFFLRGSAVAMNSCQFSTSFVPLKVGDVFVDEGYGLDFMRPESIILDTDCIICSMPTKTFWQLTRKKQQQCFESNWGIGRMVMRILSNTIQKYRTT